MGTFDARLLAQRLVHPCVDVAGRLGRFFEGDESSPATLFQAACRDGKPRSHQA